MQRKSDAYKPSPAVLRAEQTSRVAFERIADEASAREEKRRLQKAMRLEREAAGRREGGEGAATAPKPGKGGGGR